MKREDEIKKILTETEKLTFSPEETQAQLHGIINNTEALTPQELKIKNAEYEKLKIQLLGGGTTSIFEQKKLVTDLRQPYVPIFPNDNAFYTNAFKLIGITGDPKKYVKDKRVRRFTLDTIYSSFPAKIMKELKDKNPFLIKIYKRKYKLFQYLSTDGRQMVLDRRDSVNEISPDCKTLYQFSKKFAEIHGFVFQLKLYENE